MPLRITPFISQEADSQGRRIPGETSISLSGLCQRLTRCFQPRFGLPTEFAHAVAAIIENPMMVSLFSSPKPARSAHTPPLERLNDPVGWCDEAWQALKISKNPLQTIQMP